jgi:UDP-N-acetylmuramoyl-tripeptide--D-alanyl-D-alanine ligase
MHVSLEQLYTLFLENRIISTDSRQILPGSLFFALKGDNFDGNKFAAGAVEKGASYAVIDDEKFEGKNTLLVPDVLDTLQKLARFHRRKHNIPVIAITGSNGKTTTKELITKVLSRKYNTTATRGNLNNHIGVPITLLEISQKTQIAVIEMGANHQGEIAQLCSIAEPTHGMITNIGRAHLGGFGGYEGVIKAKTELYKWLLHSGGEAFVNAGNNLLMEHSAGIKRTLYGSREGVFARGYAAENSEMLVIDWISNQGKIEIKTDLVGNYNFENAMAAICAGMYFNVPEDEIRSAISEYSPSNSRSQLLSTDRNSIILDAYNANPTSMMAAIENFSQTKASNKMLILGDMLELGDESLAEHRAIVSLIEDSGISNVVLVGNDFTRAANEKFKCFGTSDEAYDWLLTQKINAFTILVKGSRGIKMERVVDAL